METLETQRLKLIPLTLEQLEIGLISINDLSASVGVPLVESLFDGLVHRAVTMKIAKMHSAPVSQHPWFTYWLIIIKEENTGAGMVGFKGIPNDQGAAEVGYGIDENFQRKGFMTEAVQTLIEWAFSHPECKLVTATNVRLDNFASQKVLVKSGFTEIGATETGINYHLLRK